MSDWGATQRITAQAVTAEGVVLEGDLHLLARMAYPPGPETPLEMLNRADAFFALTQDDSIVTFVSKAQVAVVSCRGQAPFQDPARANAAKTIGLNVVMYGGEELQGFAALELPPSRARALDYLNGAGRFFALWTDDVTRYINKDFVRLIRPLD